MDSPTRCPNCRAYNPVNTSTCVLCGTPLKSAPTQEDPEEAEAPAKGQGLLSPPPRLATDLNPRTLGELVRETFAVYIRNFWLMWRISLLANIPFFVAVFPTNPAIVSSISLAGLFTGLLGHAATVYAVARWYLGHRTNALTCYVVALSSAVALLLAFLMFMAAVVLGIALSLLVIGIPLLVFVVVIWFFFAQAIVVEGKRPVEALRRSQGLVQGSWWRVLGLGVAFLFLLLAATFGAALPGILLGSGPRIVGDLLITMGGVFTTPLGSIASTLVYLDLRVRKEDYTLETLASEIGLPQENPPR